jgi:hypothetical protein
MHTAIATQQGWLGSLHPQRENSMLRKLIMLAITSGLASKLYKNYRNSRVRTPFPTSSRPPEGNARGRARKSYPA